MAKFSYNKVQLAGRVTKDPELKTTTKGGSFVKTSIAWNHSVKQKDGSYSSEVEFFNINLWGKMAESFARFGKKGCLIFVEGMLHNEEWVKDNIKHSQSVVTATNITYIDGSEDKVEKAWYEEQEKVPSSLKMSDEMKAIADANMTTIADDVELPFG